MMALNAYALTGGADFGGGVWDLLARGPRRDAQRRLIAESIGPIWEANHVWLIVAVVVLFTGFPAAFGVLGTVLHIPLTILLIGIVLRGSAFVFRSYGRAERRIVERWGLVFSIASVVTPLCFGIVIGAISSGAVGQASARAVTAAGSFAEVYVEPWLAVYPLTVGFLALALFAMLAAVYLALAARDDALREDFRRRALVAAVVVGVAAGVVAAHVDVVGAAHRARRHHFTVGAVVARRHRDRGAHRNRRALVAALSTGAGRGRRAGDVDPVGLGARAVSVRHSARAHDSPERGARRNAGAAARRARGGSARS